MHAAFLLSFAITLLAALVSVMRPSHQPLGELGDSSQRTSPEDAIDHQSGD